MNRTNMNILPRPVAGENGQHLATKPPTVNVAEAIDDLHAQYQALRTQLAGVIVGQNEVAEQLLMTFFAAGIASCRGCQGWRKRCWSPRR